MKPLYAFLGAVCIVLFLDSCNVINPKEQIPTYVHIDSFSFAGNPSVTGSNSHKITTVSVYLNNQSVGIFDLPITFPVLLDKPGVLMMTPGIDHNGFSSNPVQYPFYRSDTFTLSPSPGQTIFAKPGTKYYDQALVTNITDFEDAIISNNPFTNVGSDTVIEPSTVDPFEGAKSGLIKLTATQDSSINVTRNPFFLPHNQDVYLELNYKSTVPMTIGLFTTVSGLGTSEYIIGLNPRATWGKVYIDLRTFASTYQGTDYYLLIRAVKDAGSGEGTVQLDNLKIVSF